MNFMFFWKADVKVVDIRRFLLDTDFFDNLHLSRDDEILVGEKLLTGWKGHLWGDGSDDDEIDNDDFDDDGKEGDY